MAKRRLSVRDRVHYGSERRLLFGLIAALASVLVGCGGATKTITERPAATQTVTNVTTTIVSSTTVNSATNPEPARVAKVQPAVVRLVNTACELRDSGTGFLIGSRLIATVDHVVDGADSLLIERDGQTIATGTVVGEDRTQDVALVAASEPIGGTALELGSRNPAVGDAVAALGYPLGLPLTVTQGSVSGLQRTIPIEGIDRHDLVQTDAAINPGNSGGPLLSLADGEVVGLVDAVTSQANGIGFAVAAQVAESLLQKWESEPQPVPGTPCPGSATSGSLPVSKLLVSTKRYDGKAFKISYPADWTLGDAEKRESYGTDTTILSPSDPSTLLRIDVTTKGGAMDPAIAAGPVINAVSNEPGYQLLDLSRETFEGHPAFHWQFQSRPAGVLQEDEDELFVDPANGDRIGILTQAPASQYNKLVAEFADLRATLSMK